MTLYGYSFRAERDLTTWHAFVRKVSWAPGVWVIIGANYGRQQFKSHEEAIVAGKLWAYGNEYGAKDTTFREQVRRTAFTHHVLTKTRKRALRS